MNFGVQVVGFKVSGLAIKFRDQASGIRVQGSRFEDEGVRTAKTQSFIFNWKSSSPESRFHIRAVSSSEHENTCIGVIV